MTHTLEREETHCLGLSLALVPTILVSSGLSIWRARTLPCPADPSLARSCAALQRLSPMSYAVESSSFVIGAVFAVGWPMLN